MIDAEPIAGKSKPWVSKVASVLGNGSENLA